MKGAEMSKEKARPIVYGMLCAVAAAAPWLFWQKPPRMFHMVGIVFMAFLTVMTLIIPLRNLKKPFWHRIHPSIYGFFVAGYILAFFVIPFKVSRQAARELARRTFWQWQYDFYGWGFAFAVIAAFFLAVGFLKNKKDSS